MRTAGIDIGTTTICGVLWDAETAKPLHAVTKSNPAVLGNGKPFEALQSPEKIMETVRAVLDEVCAGESPACIGVTGQMHGIVYLDKDGRAVSPLFTWQDRRGAEEYREGESYSAFLTKRLGRPVPSGYGLCTHFYNAENGLVPPGAKKLCTIGDYAAMRLAGAEAPRISPTNAAGLGFYRIKEKRFEEEAMEALGMPPSILPRLAGEGEMLGGPVPVLCACGDHQASFYGAVKHPEDAVAVNFGTGSQISVYSGEYLEAQGMETRPYFDGYLLTGASVSGGKAYAALADFFNGVCSAFTEKQPEPGVLYRKMEELARTAGENPLAVSNALFGARDNPGARGFIGNLSAENFTPAHFADAFLNAAADEIAVFWRGLEHVLPQRERHVVFSGNGARKNPLLREKICARLGMKGEAAPWEEEAALGAAKLAAARYNGKTRLEYDV